MRKLMMALVAGTMMALGTAPAQANEGKCPMCEGKMDAGAKVDKLALVLDLNEKQKADVKKLVDAKMDKMKPAMEEMKSAMKSAKEEFETGLKKILNEKQAKKYEDWKGLDKHKH